MQELLAKKILKVKGFVSGEKINAKVVEIGRKSVIFDIGGKSEGVVAESAFDESRDFIKKLKIGDEITVTVIAPETKEGLTLLSLRQAASDAGWKTLEIAKKDGKTVSVLGKGATDAGISVEVDNLTGFVPNSQLSRKAQENPQDVIGKHFLTRVVEVDKSRNKVVLSEKAVSEAEDLKLHQAVLREVKEGEIYDGVITRLTNFGVFVETKITVGKKSIPTEGLVHISELSWEKVKNPSDILKEGDKVKVKVIGIRDGKLALSIKKAQIDPWENVEKKYKTESKVKGKVLRHSDFGVFVGLETGVEGLIHITKIPPGIKLTEGEDVDCYIEEVDSKNRKISLGLVLKVKPVGYK
ncbi:S1 RNA-binding domain-containing protein [Candidatus Woesebacteria bacterium]|nr:S1 RNA-binding domain-containing protein [Candidatus Woesebacteria bacterium]